MVSHPLRTRCFRGMGEHQGEGSSLDSGDERRPRGELEAVSRQLQSGSADMRVPAKGARVSP